MTLPGAGEGPDEQQSSVPKSRSMRGGVGAGALQTLGPQSGPQSDAGPARPGPGTCGSLEGVGTELGGPALLSCSSSPDPGAGAAGGVPGS